ncbi:ABC transporter permease [bacterium]|nr:ABC transporter permease [bacterium]
MKTFLIKRILMIIPTFLGITLMTFFIIQLAPGDPITLKAQSSGVGIGNLQASQQIIQQTREMYGLDKPLYVQYGLWVKRVLKFDFGESYVDHRPVLSKIGDALPITLTLNILTIIVIYLVSVPTGVFSAVRPNSIIDKITMVFLFILYSLPSFWVATMLIVYFGGGDYLNLFPIAGFVSEGAENLSWVGWFGNVAWHLVLPVVCLTYGGFAFLSRFARTSMLEVIKQDYIRTAHAKGLSEWVVVFKHALRNALIPLLTLMGTLLPALLGGSVIIEQIFSIPGMGKLGFESVLNRDYPTVMAIASISAFLTLISLLITDILYAMVDPRIHFGKRK